MGTLTVLALRVVLVLVLAGSLFVQAVMAPLFYLDLDELTPEYAHLRLPLVVLPVLGIVAVQVTVLCVWRLLTMVRRGTVFSHAAFRYVDIVIGTIAAASLLPMVLAFYLAPGEAVAPGIVLLICGGALIVAGIALVVLVLRMLLAQAVALDAATHHLRAELDGVI